MSPVTGCSGGRRTRQLGESAAGTTSARNIGLEIKSRAPGELSTTVYAIPCPTGTSPGGDDAAERGAAARHLQACDLLFKRDKTGLTVRARRVFTEGGRY